MHKFQVVTFLYHYCTLQSQIYPVILKQSVHLYNTLVFQNWKHNTILYSFVH